MAAITTTKQSVINADNFISNYVSEANYLYLAIAKSDAWNSDIASNVDSVPFVPYDSAKHLNEFRSNLIALKRVLPAQMVKVVPRYDWQNGTTYVGWNDEIEGIDFARFYVMTSSFDVYKCLKAGAGASTIQPSHIDVEPQIYADGYVWHYLYRVTASDGITFLNSEFMPVRNSSTPEHITHEESCQTYLNGGIFSISVTNGGSGYVSAPTVTIQGAGAGAAATATISGGIVTAININTINTNKLAHGTGYNNAKIVISAPPSGGVQATANAILSPDYGHGTNAENELYAYYVELAVSLTESESGTFLVGNDFRQIGLIRNPVEYGEEKTNYATGITMNALASLELTSVSGGNFAADDVIKQTSGTNLLARAFVDKVSTDSPYTIHFHQNDKTGWVPFQTTQNIANGNGTGLVTATINAINTPDVDAYSGDVIYLENRKSIIRTDTSREEIRLIMQF